MSAPMYERRGSAGSQPSSEGKEVIESHNKKHTSEPTVSHNPVLEVDQNDDDAEDERLRRMGYENNFKREFKSLSTFSFAMSIMGLTSSIITVSRR